MGLVAGGEAERVRRPRGRPRVAAETSQVPAVRVPAALHDALARRALREGHPVAVLIRRALRAFLHLENGVADETGAGYPHGR